METKNFGMTEHYGVIMRNLVYFIKYSWYMHNIVRIYPLFLVQKKAVINTFITTLFLRLFPMKGLHLHCLKAIAQVYP